MYVQVISLCTLISARDFSCLSQAAAICVTNDQEDVHLLSMSMMMITMVVMMMTMKRKTRMWMTARFASPCCMPVMAALELRAKMV